MNKIQYSLKMKSSNYIYLKLEFSFYFVLYFSIDQANAILLHCSLMGNRMIRILKVISFFYLYCLYLGDDSMNIRGL